MDFRFCTNSWAGILQIVSIMCSAKSFGVIVLSVIGLNLSAVSAHGAGEVRPVITSITSQDGSLLVAVELGAGDLPVGNWFYQVRNYLSECANPYGNDSTWNTTGLVPSFQIGNRTDLSGPIDDYDLRLPLTNGCTYTINVAHWNGSVGEYASTTAVVGLAPIATTSSADLISTNSARLNAAINSNSLSAEASFCIATSSDLSGCTIYTLTESPITSTSSTPVAYNLTGLSSGTTYYFRFVATTAVASSSGEIQSFTTSHTQDQIAQIQRDQLNLEKTSERKEINEKKHRALSKISTLTEVRDLNVDTLSDAGVSYVIPETLSSLGEFIYSLDIKQRSDIKFINQRAKELYISYYFDLLDGEVTASSLSRLGFSEFSQEMLPEISSYLKGSQALLQRNQEEIQRVIDTVKILFKARESRILSYSELKVIGVEFSIPAKALEVAHKLRDIPISALSNPDSLQREVIRIEQEIRERLERTRSAKLKTLELAKLISTRG